MYKYSFYNDYSEGAHPRILELLAQTNNEQQKGYGEDEFCEKAKEMLKKEMHAPYVDIHFVSAGTQANLIMLAAMMKPYESVIAAQSAHINVHEAGAVEATGHKINTIVSQNGKITVSQIEEVIVAHHDEHLVKPKVVFISQATERGTVYTKNEIKIISDYCHAHDLYLYLDGARLGMGLMSSECDATLSGIVELVDAFYIGGTKNGALIGEAIVIVNENLKKEFRFYLKQRGGLLAKGRILEIQFIGLFENGIYFENAKHANEMAEILTKGIKELGYNFLAESSTNQIFPIFPDPVIAALEQMYGFYVWERVNETHSAIRLVTSWATQKEKVESFLEDLKNITE